MGNAALYLAFVDGELVACGDTTFRPFTGFLAGAVTLPAARGRGAFRALVRARWDEAVRRGTPALTVGAGKMSRPILERLGFETVAELHVLLDRSCVSS
jgi:GNAT superfamily N-acetyltransferase